jgi:hypothetical protein
MGGYMKTILVLLFLSYTLLFAFTDPAFVSTTYNPSSTSLGLGDVTGVANIWSGDPLNVWSNPALVTFHDGIRVGYTNYKWLQGLDWGKLNKYNSSSYMSYAKNGWGCSFPILNHNGMFGTTFDNGQFTYPGQSPAGHSYELSSEVSFAYNPFYNLHSENDNVLPGPLTPA